MEAADISIGCDPRELGLYKELSGLSQDKAKHLRRAITAYINDTYERARGAPKYGNLPKAFDTGQLRLFFSGITNPVHRFKFLLQFFFALRVGELNDVEPLWDQNLLRVENKKCRRVEYLPLYKPIKAYLWTHRHFFAIRLSRDYLAKRFRMYRAKHKELSYVYGYSSHKKPMPLYQFTDHSLRHTAINVFRKSVKDPYVVSLFSRHKPKELGVMSTYYHHDTDDLRVDLEKAFNELRDILV